MGIPLAGWAIFAVSLIIVLYVAGHFGLKLYYERQDALLQKAASDRKAQQAAAVNADTSIYSNAVTKEMDRHKKDGSGHHIVLHKEKLVKLSRRISIPMDALRLHAQVILCPIWPHLNLPSNGHWDRRGVQLLTRHF